MTTKTTPNHHRTKPKSKSQNPRADQSVSDVQVLQQLDKRASTPVSTGAEDEVRRVIEAHKAAKAHLEAVTDRVMEEEFTAELRVLNNEAEHAELRAAASFLAALNDYPIGGAEEAILRQYLHETINDNLTIEHSWQIPREWVRIVRDQYRAGDSVHSDNVSDAPACNTCLDLLISRHQAASHASEIAYASDIPEAESQRFYEAETVAFEAILSWQCSTIAEIERKASYIVDTPAVGERLFETELTSPSTFISQFMRSMLPTKAITPTDHTPDILEVTASEASWAYDFAIEYESKAADARKSKDATSGIYFEDAHNDAYDRYVALRDALSACEAKSNLGAMVQLAEAVSTFDLMCSQIDKVPIGQKRAIDRLVTSALRFLERQNGAGLEQLGFGCLRNSNVDPWEPVEKRLSRITNR